MNKIFKTIKDDILNNCPHCAGQGWTLDSNGLQAPCSCMKELFSIAACDKGNVPVEYWKHNIRQFPGDPSVLNAIRTVVAERPSSEWSFIFSGGYRIGKTSLAIGLAKYNTMIHKDASIFYVTARDLESSIFKSDDDLENRCREADFLIVDDLGKETTFSSKEPNKRKIRIVLDEVIRSRRGVQPTVITTNLTFDMLKEHYGKNLALIFQYDFNYIEFPRTAPMLNT